MIITNNDSFLRSKCENVLPDEVGSLIDKLESALKYSEQMGNPGIGLSAPQIGILKKIAIVRIPTNVEPVKLNLVNADIIKVYDKKIFKNEGCLSYPGRLEDTIRYQEIVVNNQFCPVTNFVATGLTAVVVQHEINHFNGVLFFDHMVKKQNQSLNPNDICYCGSNRKYKKCCKNINKENF